MTSSVSSLSNIPPRDPKLVQEVVDQLKSNGIFDQLRRDCLADVDTKPAYQNLRQRVEGYVSNFLCKQTWRPDLNKNQLRDQLRRQINQSGMLLNGVDRIIDQVVNPKIFSLFKPVIEKVVYNYLGVDKDQILAQQTQQPAQTTNVLSQGSNAASGITFPPFAVNQNISFTNFNPGSSPISPYNTYSPYNQSQPTSFSSYKQPQQVLAQSQAYKQPTQTAYTYPLTTYNSNGGPNNTVLNSISMATESPEKMDITPPSLEVDLQSTNSGITHQRQDSECFEQMNPVSRCNDLIDFKNDVIVCKNEANNNASDDIHFIRKLEFEIPVDNLEPKERILKIDVDESYIKNERVKEKKPDAQRKSNFDVAKVKFADNSSKSFENKGESKSLKLKSSSFDRHYPDSPKGKLGEFLKSKSPAKGDNKIKVSEDKTKGSGSDDLKYKSKCIEDKKIKTVEESKGKHGENEENKCKIHEDGKLKSKSEDSKSKSSHKDDGKAKYKVFDNAKQKNRHHDEKKLKNRVNDLEKQKFSGNEEKNKSKTCDLKVKSEERLREDKFKSDEKIKSLFRPDKLKLLNSKFKLINTQELRSKPSSDSKSSSDSSKSFHCKSEGKSSESQGLYDSKSSSEGYSSSSDKQKISPIPIKRSKPDKLNLKPIKLVQSSHPKTKLFPIEKTNKEETLESKDKLHDSSRGNSEKATAIHDAKHDVGDLSDADSLAGWSDITVSSVHTCDLSSFDEEITLTSSDEDEETTKLNADKTKNISPDEALKPIEAFVNAEVHDGHPIEQKAKPKRLISLMGRYSDSDDEETKEEKRARMATAKEIRAERRAKLREKLEEKRKQTESIMAKIKEIKDKKTKMTFEKVVTGPPNKLEEKIEEKKNKRIATSSIKETLKQHKVIEKKMALRRQRKINRRYMCDDFYFPKSLAICTMQSSECSQEEEQSDNITDFSQTDTSCSEKYSNDSPLKRRVKTLTLVTVKDDEAGLSSVESLPPTPTQDEQFFPNIPKQDQNSNSSIPIVEIQTPTPTYLSKLSHSDVPVIYSEPQPSQLIERNRKSFKRHSDTSHGSAPSSTKSSSSLIHEDDRQRSKIASSRRQSLPEPSSSSDRLSKSKVRSSENYASQRYDDSDLYKPRSIIPSSRRSRGSPPPQQSVSQCNRGYSPERKRPRYSPPPRSMISLRESKLQEEERLRMNHIISSQRYDTSDLYKPRTTNSGRSSRFCRRNSPPPRNYKRPFLRDNTPRGLNHDKRSRR